jgi:hypothetical protein
MTRAETCHACGFIVNLAGPDGIPQRPPERTRHWARWTVPLSEIALQTALGTHATE